MSASRRSPPPPGHRTRATCRSRCSGPNRARSTSGRRSRRYDDQPAEDGHDEYPCGASFARCFRTGWRTPAAAVLVLPVGQVNVFTVNAGRVERPAARTTAAASTPRGGRRRSRSTVRSGAPQGRAGVPDLGDEPGRQPSRSGHADRDSETRRRSRTASVLSQRPAPADALRGPGYDRHLGRSTSPVTASTS